MAWMQHPSSRIQAAVYSIDRRMFLSNFSHVDGYRPHAVKGRFCVQAGKTGPSLVIALPEYIFYAVTFSPFSQRKSPLERVRRLEEK
mmetsp:Transcript_23736/g.93490  ORF Transcript_23736/g.93490 Transcript_23736/m.93490 type:complete len:87 (-) Transcript_23736:72-332(-)